MNKDETVEKYFDYIVTRQYNFISSNLEVIVNDTSMLINNEASIKEVMLQLLTIGFEANINSRRKKIVATTGKPVLQFSLEGKFIKEYPAISIAERELGLKDKQISNSLFNNGKTAGYYWVRKSDYSPDK